MLQVRSVQVHYGSAQALRDVTLEVGPGQIVCLVGRNGAGKTTTLKAIMGLARVTAGEIVFQGARIDGRPPHRVARLGVAYVPEDRRMFGSLTVEENVRVAGQAVNRPGSGDVRAALAGFPDLLSRAKQLAASLSGGQQQMLAMARALVTAPQLMLLDEPTEGLSPALVQAIRLGILEARSRGVSILLVEQNLNLALAVGDMFFVLSRGGVAFRGTRSELLGRPEVIAEHVGVGRVRERPR
jgi:branched-chain amino acid transport system ATP-binding protein